METHFLRIGGEDTIRRLVDRFYDLMDEDPDYYCIRKMHARDLTEARNKLFMFLSGWTGGPQLYMEKFGHPRLRQRHMPFAIGESERDQWMACMQRAMDEVGVDEKLREELTAAFWKTADFMRNREE
ncbi:MAG: group II truncated hemoglobin [Gammaproteobacteria bacterium]|nr:group II truncated hemoglobin [Gammaproteobacteria bacterium]MBU1730756.1 group II truncated hemoglobin [Gammaproteobacteria bacterium]MBU1891302.1 group II truncated hemoglobin [Gammaproteobacteria bacterium]